MNNLSSTAISARTFIYALDPNRHLTADVPFPEYLAFLVRISARQEGLPVPEWGLLEARARCRDNAFWKEIADELLAGVREAQPAIPVDIPQDPEEAWRRKIFTYPPGRYAILRCGENLARIAGITAANPGSLYRNRKYFEASENPWDRAVARASIDSRPTVRGYSMSMKTWIHMEEIRAKDRGAFAIAIQAARLVPESKPKS